MPKGIYKRKPGLKRNISEEARQRFRDNLAKARSRIAEGASDKAIEARQKNVSLANRVKQARGILKRVPLGATAGTVFCGCRKTQTFEVIDPKPIQVAGGKWEQKFRAGGHVTLYGVRKDFSGIVKITWEYEPNIENIMEQPIYSDTE